MIAGYDNGGIIIHIPAMPLMPEQFPGHPLTANSRATGTGCDISRTVEQQNRL
jgi:hypothetical protein